MAVRRERKEVFYGEESDSSEVEEKRPSIEETQVQAWQKSRFRGSPRKYFQGARQTGLFMNSPCSFQITTPKKAASQTSPASSTSSTPSKHSPLTSPQKYRKALFRDERGVYLENMIKVIDTVLAEPQDVSLLSEKDLEVITAFRNLSLSAQKLYVRLFQRKVDLKRVSKIHYEEVCDQEDTGKYVRELVEAGFLLKEEDLGGLPQFLNIMSNDELKNVCKDFKVSAKGRKEDRMKALLQHSRNQPTIMAAFSKKQSGLSPLLRKVKEVVGQCCMVDHTIHRVFGRLLVLYGLPSFDDIDDTGASNSLTTLLLVNIGKTKYPKYKTQRTMAIFRTQEDLHMFEKCYEIHKEVQYCMENKKWEEALKHCSEAKHLWKELLKDEELQEHEASLPWFLRRYTALSRLTYIISESVMCYEKMRHYKEAITQLDELLGQKTHLREYRGRWYIRTALNLHSHLKKPEKALEAIRSGLEDSALQPAHRLELSNRARKLEKLPVVGEKVFELHLEEPVQLKKETIVGRCLNRDIPGNKRPFIRQDSDRHAGEGSVTLCSVEELVIGHYKDKGYPEGIHMEGTVVCSLFGLFFWDVLYAPVPDVFRSPHQSSPLDLYDMHFYSSRSKLIDKRLSDLKSLTEEEVDAELERVWTEHREEVCVVAWYVFRSLSYVQGLVKSLGMRVLAAICERLAKNYRHTRSGFPDLIVWNPETKESRIVEVKGPNDTLSEKQEIWLDYLLKNGAEAVVCHVEAVGAKKMGRTPCKATPKKSQKKSATKTCTVFDCKRSDSDSSPDLQRKSSKRTKSSSDDDFVPEPRRKV